MMIALAAGAARAYRYFGEDRREFASAAHADSSFNEVPETYVRVGRKVERNDTLPCGSDRSAAEPGIPTRSTDARTRGLCGT